MVEFTEFEDLVNNLGDAVVVCDAGGKITFWNGAAQRMFGFTRAEALGSSLDIIIPDRIRKRQWDGFHKTMETGHTKYGNDVLRVPAIGKGGKSLSIAFTVAIIYGHYGNVVAIASVMRDETGRSGSSPAQAPS